MNTTKDDNNALPLLVEITLLDDFAGRVLTGLLAIPGLKDHNTALIAAYCYDQAEAMLTERSKRVGPTEKLCAGRSTDVDKIFKDMPDNCKYAVINRGGDLFYFAKPPRFEGDDPVRGGNVYE